MGASHSYRYVSVSVSSSYNGTIKVGTSGSSTSSTTPVNLGFKPSYLAVMYVPSSSSTRLCSLYDSRLSTTQFFYGTNQSGYSGGWATMPYAGVHRIAEITSTGFTITKDNNSTSTFYYFAIK